MNRQVTNWIQTIYADGYRRRFDGVRPSTYHARLQTQLTRVKLF